jgi:hypothetical protein
MKNADCIGPLPCGANVQPAPPPVNVTVAVPLPVAVGPLKLLSDGVTLFDGADAGPVPDAFVAVTVKV